MKNLGNMLKQAQQMQAKMAEMQAGLEQIEIEGHSGGDMVTVVLSGKGEMRRVKIAPSLIADGEAEIVEDLVVAAHNDARTKLELRMADEMAKVTGGLSLPPGFKLPFG